MGGANYNYSHASTGGGWASSTPALLLEELAAPWRAWVDEQWLRLVGPCTWSDAVIFAVGTYVIHSAMSLAFSTFYCLAHSRGWFLRYRIQATAPWDPALFRTAMQDFLKRAVFTEFPGMLAMYYGFHHFGTEVRAPLPPATRILRDWVLCWLWTETTFYWSHRMLHHRWFYKAIHKQHHEFKTSIALNTEYANPIEHLISNVMTTFGAPLLLGTHVLVFWAYLVFRLWETLDAHSGYTLPGLSPFAYIPWWTGPQMHDYHHSHNVGSYGTMTCFWDWLCGTDQSYREFEKKQRAKLKAL